MDFVVGHPRSGTALFAQIFNAAGKKLAFHEFLPVHYGGGTYLSAVNRYLAGERDAGEVKAFLRFYDFIGTARVDSNWTLTWVLDAIADMFPNAKVLHLSRHPRDNIGSCYNLGYYREFTPKMISDPMPAINQMQGDLLAVAGLLTESITWLKSLPEFGVEGWQGLSPFEKNCVFWAKTHQRIFDVIPRFKNRMRFSLEETNSISSLRQVFDFFEIPRPSDDEITAVIEKKINPQNEFRQVLQTYKVDPLPAWEELSDSKKRFAFEQCADVAERLGYSLEKP